MINPIALRTPRLELRPTAESDAARAFEILTAWEVARMLRLPSFPPDRAAVMVWFADHARERRAGEAVRFAACCDGRMIGVVDVDEIADREGSLGYWFDRSVWGRGYAFESAQRVVSFVFDDLGLLRLRAGHAQDNPASGRVLMKVGFAFVGAGMQGSRSRGKEILQHNYELRASRRVAGGSRC